MKKIKLGQTVSVNGEMGVVKKVGTVSSEIEIKTLNGPKVIEVLNTSITIVSLIKKLWKAISGLWSKKPSK